MTEDARQEPADEPPVFSAEITPHRSLTPRGFLIVMVAFASLSIAVSVPFYLVGAWPVLGFLGVDVLALWIAFRLSFAQARACEQIVLSYVELFVRKISRHGIRREWRFNPLWVRVSTESDDDFGMTRISLAERGRELDLAGALSPKEREEFAKALGSALATVKRGARAADA